MGLTACKCPFSRLCALPEACSARLPGSLGVRAQFGPWSWLWRRCPATFHSTADATLPTSWPTSCGHSLVNQVQRQLIAQQQPSTGLKTGALSDRAMSLCFLAKKQCQGDEAACLESQFASGSSPSQEPSCPWKKMTQGWRREDFR